MRRVFSFIIIGIVAIICIAIATVYLSIGSVITGSIEKYGTAITGTAVTLEEADYSSSSGETILLGLSVSSPPDFKAEPAFLAPYIEMLIDPQTISTEVIVIKRMEIKSPEITYEILQNGDNLRALRHRIEQAVTAEQGGTFAPEMTGPTAKFIINDLYINKGVVIVEAETLTGHRSTALLEDIHLQDIGREENGLLPAALIRRIYTPVVQATTIAALSTDLPLTEQVINLIRGASDETGEMIERLRKLLEK
jgi:hypothetical protein|tara:strand:- start:9317 stop:10072 length:756 start_codon:yes stop_codon:yes gene_type:complete